MTLTHESVESFRRPRRVVLGLAGWSLFLAGGLSASAAPLTSVHVKSHHSSHPITAFEAYLNGGPAHWAKTQLMELPSGVKLTKHHGQLKNNLVVDYVMWVR